MTIKELLETKVTELSATDAAFAPYTGWKSILLSAARGITDPKSTTSIVSDK
jgi:hypothetical protein